MKEIDYITETERYDAELNNFLITYKNEYDDAKRQEIFKLCRKISRCSIPDSPDSQEKVKEEVLRPFFLRSLKSLKNDSVIDYFNEKTGEVKIYRDNRLSSQESGLEFEKRRFGKNRYKLILPKADLTVSEQMGYAHEIGHIPEIEKERKSFLEYSEALPIFMEYLIQLRRYHDRDKALDNFLLERLKFEQVEARNIMKMYKNVNSPNEVIRNYFSQAFADTYKFFESLEFVLQLIDRMGSDLYAVGDEIEAVTGGKSLIETADSLDIVTDGCPTLLKEYKRMSR